MNDFIYPLEQFTVDGITVRQYHLLQVVAAVSCFAVRF